MGEFFEAAVIGAGVMGSGIAAQLANAGLTVALLDINPAAATAAIARQLKIGGFSDPAHASRVHPGSSVTELNLLDKADWIIEAVAERLPVKRQLYEAIDAVRKTGSIVSSTTSTFPLSKLTEGMDRRFSADFLITHFFNPPHLMRLMELISGPATRPDATRQIIDFSKKKLDRSVVLCKDTPGFIANRIGTFWIFVAIHEAIAQGLDVEEADAVICTSFGVPAGVFGLVDLIGIDLLPHGARSLQSALPPNDPFQSYPAEPPLIAGLIAQGRYGRKAGGGFMRRGANGTSEVLDLLTGEYRLSRSMAIPALQAAGGDLRSLMSHHSPSGRLAAHVIARTLAYAASLIPEIADSPDLVDQAMRDGYSWKLGPFELIERIGAPWLVDQLMLRGIDVPLQLHGPLRRSSNSSPV